MKHEEPVVLCNDCIHLGGNGSCWNIVHDDQTFKPLRMILGKARSNTCTAVMAYQSYTLYLKAIQQGTQVIGHGALVIACRRLFSLTITS